MERGGTTSTRRFLMSQQKKNNIEKKIIQYFIFSFLIFAVAGLIVYQHKKETQKRFFDYYLGVMSVDVDSGSIPETGANK